MPALLAPLLLAALPLAPAPAEVQVPENDGWVTDLAGLLTPDQEAGLESRLDAYQRGSGHDLAVLTVPSLEGESIERLALETSRAWKLGREGENDGALFVVARDDREMRIEVGRGLEGTLTDSICGRIIREIAAPAFRKGDYHLGIAGAIDALQRTIGGESIFATGEAGRAARGIGAALGTLFFVLLMLGVLGRGRRGGGGLGGILPWLVLSQMGSGRHSGGFGGGGGFRGGGFGGGGFGGFGGGGGFSGGGASGGW